MQQSCRQLAQAVPDEVGPHDADKSGAGLVEHLFDELQQAIVAGQMRPGSKVSEPELARRYGVSRAPLREAMSRLEACGLLVRKPKLGARVVTLSNEQLLEIYQVRESLEGLAARLAAAAMSDDEIERLRKLLACHQEQIAKDPEHAYFQKEGDLDFHFRIIQGSGNQHLIGLLCEDLYYLVRMYRQQSGMQSQRGPVALQEHAHIVDAIARRDGELAELLMRHHIRASRENVERLLAEELKR